LTKKLDQFLDSQNLATPCLVVDLDEVANNYRRLKDAMPMAEIYYAVKANPAGPVLQTLHSLGSSFDAASIAEIDRCLAAGASPASISYGSTIKKQGDIATAYGLGVRIFGFDCENELAKLAIAAPGSKVYCRVLVENAGAAWPLAKKFGCSVEMAVDLMVAAKEKGLVPHGISFHVGSQQTDTVQWDAAIAKAAMIFTDLREKSIEPEVLNLGGGFPTRYRDDVPEYRQIANAIHDSMQRHFGNRQPALMLEPGRCIPGSAGVIRSEVILVSKRSYDTDVRWVYLDVGKFGGLAETMDEAIQYPIRTPHDGGPEGPVMIAGPTCDGADVLYEKAGYKLPLALKEGDHVDLMAAGAYTASYASIGFNGIPPLMEYYI
jgi:ornithine decarboxylase